MTDVTTTVKYRDEQVCTSATTFNQSAVIHTQVRRGTELFSKVEPFQPREPKLTPMTRTSAARI